jgi:predicted ATPase
MSMLQRLTVRGFKSIRELEGFELGSLNVLIGANGAGKSNFISLFRMLAELYEQRLQRFVQEQDGPDALLFGGRKRTPKMEAEFYFGQNGYLITLEPLGDRLVFTRETTCFSGDHGDHRYPLGGRTHDESRLAKMQHDRVASYVIAGVTGWRVYHFHDTSISAPVRQKQAVRDNLRLKPDAGNLAAYLRLLREKHEGHYCRIVETVRLVAPFFGDFVYRDDPGERIELEWHEAADPDTVWGPRQLSDGTLRFVCLATLLLQPEHLQPSTILLDEPELGLHPYALAVLSDLLRQASDQRQLIVSTQSVELIDRLKPEDVVVVSRKDGASVFERLDAERLSDWLADYALGDLWKMNVIGGRPTR